jgi:hypothetical protein
VVDLFQESPFLYDVGNGLLTNAAALVDVFEGIEFLGALMLDDPHLAKGSLAHRTMKVEMIEVDFSVKVHRFRKAASHISFLERGYIAVAGTRG